MIAALLASAHDGFDWTVLVVGSIAAAGSVVGVILAGVLLWRGRPEAKLGPARFIRGNADDVVIAVDIHIVSGGHWVLKELVVTFTANGVVIDQPKRSDNLSDLGVGQLHDQLVYEMSRPDTDVIKVDASLKFRHGGKPTRYQGVVSLQ